MRIVRRMTGDGAQDSERPWNGRCDSWRRSKTCCILLERNPTTSLRKLMSGIKSSVLVRATLVIE